MAEKSTGATRILKFVLPSLLGVALFLIPIPSSSGMTLLINLIINWTKQLMGAGLIPFTLLVLAVSAVCSLIGFLKKDLFKGYWGRLFNVGIVDCVIRVLAFALGCMIYFEAGPAFLRSADTGGMMLYDIVSSLIPYFLWAGFFLPLLTDFGLMEFIGNLVRPVMRPLFKVPGRSAVNCAVAWVGSGTMGIVLTNREYEDGFYTAKEAIAISTGFSVASIAVTYLLCSFMDMTAHFVTIYLCCLLVGFVVNMIMVRIPPISRKSDDYFPGAPKRDISETIPEGYSRIGYAFKSAVVRASEPKGNILASGLKVTGDIWLTLEPIVLLIGTIATVIVEYTPIAHYLSLPFAGLMGLLGLPEAAAAGQSVLLGGVDIFLPFITGGAIAAPMTKFVIAVVCILQIIYITESGPLLMKLKMGLRVWELVVIFLLRTVLALLLVTPVAYLLF